jgi:hypothetical protein
MEEVKGNVAVSANTVLKTSARYKKLHGVVRPAQHQRCFKPVFAKTGLKQK